MKRSRFSEKQIIDILKEQEGRDEDDRHVPQTRCQRRDLTTSGRSGTADWRSPRPSGFKALEEENARLTRLRRFYAKRSSRRDGEAVASGHHNPTRLCQ